MGHRQSLEEAAGFNKQPKAPNTCPKQPGTPLKPSWATGKACKCRRKGTCHQAKASGKHQIITPVSKLALEVHLASRQGRKRWEAKDWTLVGCLWVCTCKPCLWPIEVPLVCQAALDTCWVLRVVLKPAASSRPCLWPIKVPLVL